MLKFGLGVFAVLVGLYLISSGAFYEQFFLFVNPLMNPFLSMLDAGMRVVAGFALIVLAWLAFK